MLKRMRLSDDDVTSNDSTDNLTYLLDIKEQQIWNGDKVIPIGCLSVGKSLGKGPIEKKRNAFYCYLVQGKGNSVRWLREPYEV